MMNMKKSGPDKEPPYITTNRCHTCKHGIINYATLATGRQCNHQPRRFSSSRATVTICPISSAALTPICSTLARASSEDTRGFSPLPSAWRRAISPRTAVTMKLAFVSPGCSDDSIPLTTSCGNLALSCCDLLLIELLDMFSPPVNGKVKCIAKVNTKKALKWYSVRYRVNTRLTTCAIQYKTKPRKCRYHSQGF